MPTLARCSATLPACRTLVDVWTRLDLPFALDLMAAE